MDRRTKRQKLQEMANQSVSPNEAEIARKKLEELGPEPAQRTGRVFFNGQELGKVVHFEFNFVDLDPGFGAYDFVKEEWVWSKPSGTK